MKTYYMILGVSSSEGERGIRAAYRDLAKKLHPDVAGPTSTRAFQEVTEAYDVLSDPERRRDYNEQLSRAKEEVPRAAPEPIVRIPKYEHLEDLDFEVLLTHEEATRGCPVEVPVYRRRRGIIEEEIRVLVRIPPMTRSGSIFELPLRSLGIHNFHLRLHVFVEPPEPDASRWF